MLITQSMQTRLNEIDAKSFLKGYLDCALWASPSSDDGKELDNQYSLLNLTHDALTKISEECEKWQKENKSLLEMALQEKPKNGLYSLGVDFFLTRNRHGTGFWDKGYSEELSDNLTKASEKAGSRILIESNPVEGKLEYVHG